MTSPWRQISSQFRQLLNIFSYFFNYNAAVLVMLSSSGKAWGSVFVSWTGREAIVYGAYKRSVFCKTRVYSKRFVGSKSICIHQSFVVAASMVHFYLLSLSSFSWLSSLSYIVGLNSKGNWVHDTYSLPPWVICICKDIHKLNGILTNRFVAVKTLVIY